MPSFAGVSAQVLAIPLDQGGPSLELNFMAMASIQALDPRITFSRDSNATMFDSQGRLVWAPANMALHSENFANAIWGSSGGGVTKTTGITDPNGGTAAATITASGASGVLQASNTSVPGQSYTVSMSIKRRTGTGQIQLRAVENANTNITVTDSWQRFSATAVATSTVLRVGLAIVTAGDAVDIAFPQAEPTGVDSPKAYNSTGSSASPYYGPRLDYNPATLTARGLLVEEARTNIYETSRAFSVGTGAAIAQNAPGIDAVGNQAWTVTESTGASVHQFTASGNCTFVTATQYTASVSITPGTATRVQLTFPSAFFGAGQYANFDLTGAGAVFVAVGCTASIQKHAGDTYRCSITATSTAGAATVGLISFFFIDSNSAARAPSYTGTGLTLVVDAAQGEAGAFATSYIPTFGTAATRAIEQASMTGANFTSWYNQAAGTIAIDLPLHAPNDGVNARRFLDISDGTSSNRIQGIRTATGSHAQMVTSVGGTTEFGPTVVAVANAANRVVWSTTAVRKASSVNGGAVVVNSLNIPVSGMTQLIFGSQVTFPAVNYHNSWISRIRYWPRADFTDAQLQALST